MAVVVLPVGPQSRHPACLAMFPPERRINPVVGIKRRDDDIGDPAVTFGPTRFARKLNADLPKLCRKRCVQDRLGMGALHMDFALFTGLRPLPPPTIISALLRLPQVSSG